MLTTLLIILADIAVGGLALKLSKSNEKVVATLQETQSTTLLLLAKHGERLDNHDEQIADLKKAA